jgi:hypothetical protein
MTDPDNDCDTDSDSDSDKLGCGVIPEQLLFLGFLVGRVRFLGDA